MRKKYLFENDYIIATNTCYDSFETIGSHSHEESAISYIFQGQNIETANSNKRIIGNSSLVIKPKGIEHENQYFDNCLILCIYLKPSLQLPYRLTKIMDEWNSIGSFNVQPFLEVLKPNTHKSLSKDIINALLEGFAEKMVQEKAPPEWLLDIKNIIETSYQENLTTKDLAKYTNNHPVYLARIFKQFFGFGIKEYLHLQRNNAVMARMTAEKQSLSQIAYDCGFSDQSHMSRKTKQSSGLTPLQLKEILR
jgi:AraC family transcriptional regulator